MKTLFIGLVLGAIAVWSWYHTGGKIHITEIKTITNVVVVTVTETQIVEQLAYQYITKTNEVWKTNITEIIMQTKSVEPVTPVVQKVTEQPKIARPVTAPASVNPSKLKESRSTIVRDAQGKPIRVKRNMDGSIKQ